MEYKLANSAIAKEISKELMEVGAVKLKLDQPFIWSSGWKSPIYCDNRITLSYPNLRTKIREFLVESIRSNHPKATAIAGVATAGIPQGALVADQLGLPFLYVRSKPKGHGMENLIEGRLAPDQKIVVIEDLISTGGSSLKAIEALRKGGAEVLCLMATFNYGFPLAEKNCTEAKVPVIYLSDYSTLIAVAREENIISSDQETHLKKWREAPEKWGNE